MLTEKQFKGRLLLTPAFFTSDFHTEHIQSFIQSLKEYGLTNIIILTSDKLENIETEEIYTVNTIPMADLDRKSTRLNSSHVSISYAVFCLNKKQEREDDGVQRID